jgi:hypothetical protein
VVYHDDVSARQLTGWNEWVIDLSDFDVDVTNVDTIAIGIGTKNSGAPGPGGTGTLHFDDIRLVRSPGTGSVTGCSEDVAFWRRAVPGRFGVLQGKKMEQF